MSTIRSLKPVNNPNNNNNNNNKLLQLFIYWNQHQCNQTIGHIITPYCHSKFWQKKYIYVYCCFDVPIVKRFRKMTTVQKDITVAVFIINASLQAIIISQSVKVSSSWTLRWHYCLFKNLWPPVEVAEFSTWLG